KPSSAKASVQPLPDPARDIQPDSQPTPEKAEDTNSTPTQNQPAAPPSWSTLRVALIDDAMLRPSINRVPEAERTAVQDLLTADPEIVADLEAFGVTKDQDVDARLEAIAAQEGGTFSLARLADISASAFSMTDQHRTFLRLHRLLRQEVAEV